MEVKRRSLVAIVFSSLLVLAFAAPAAAQPQIGSGLVNVIVGDVTVQLPVAIAANVCDVNINVLARQSRTGGATCNAVADSTATWPPSNGGGNGGPQIGAGLVNVIVGDVTIQAPIGVAANLCDINANILSVQVREGGAQCDAKTTSVVNP